MKRTILLASLLGTVLVTTSGCSSLGKTLGLVKQPPDEYTVVENAPLTMPPDFGLRPPAANSGRPIDTNVQDQAVDTIFTTAGAQGATTASNGNNLSPGESALLDQAGASNADPAIRDQLGQDAATGDSSLIHRILYWHRTPSSDQTLDAQKEEDRIQSDISNGKPITSGNSPTIQRTNRTIFDAL